MYQTTHVLQVTTPGKGLVDITVQVQAWLASTHVRQGLLTIFIQHTSASLTIQENADPDVLLDLADFFERRAPEDAPYRHLSEGPDDMPAHIRAALTQTQLTVPVLDGRAALGTWQGIYVFEHRASSHQRQIALHVTGD